MLSLFLCELFVIMDGFDFVSYADDNTPYTLKKLIEEVIQDLENAQKILFKCFNVNQMKANSNKCHFAKQF